MPPDHQPPTEDDIERAAAVLREGGLVIFPTETVYGIGAAVDRVEAIRRIFEVKARPIHQAMTVHLGPDVDPGRFVLNVPDAARRLMHHYWPGPITVVLPSRPEVPEVVHGGAGTVGLRVPDHPVTLELFAHLGTGVVATSANRHGEPSPTTAAEALAQVGDAAGAVLDGGPCEVGIDSTVVDCSGIPLRVLRVGAVAPAEIEAIAGEPVEVPGA